MNEFKDHVLVDGDEILYKAGFAAQKTYYTLHRGKGTKPLIDFMFPGKRYAESYIPDLPDMHTEPYVQLKPHHNFMTYVDDTINGIKKMAGKSKAVVFFSEGVNFRYEVAKIVPYKGNRAETRKPLMMAEIKEYVLRKYKTHVVKDIEVDDALGLYQDDTTVISTQDKDLNGVPGWRVGGKGPFQHKDGLRLITPDEALRFFYCQLLSGDSTDNIVGLYRYGLVKAEKYYLKELGKPPHKESELYQLALTLYQKAIKDSEGLGRNLDPKRDAESQMIEIGQLLHMQRPSQVVWGKPDADK